MNFANKMSYLPRPGQITHLVRKKAWRRIHQIYATYLLLLHDLKASFFAESMVHFCYMNES